MDRDLGTPKKSPKKAHRHVQGGAWAAGLPMKQLHRCLTQLSTRNAASSKAHDKDATLNKEFTGEH